MIDETPNIVQVSSFNPIRREIAIRTLKKLIADGRIQPVKIEQELIEQERLLDDSNLEIGQEVINELGITNMDPELIRLVGKLKYRTSYSQNVLTHSIEVAKIAGQIANELELDSMIATRAGLLHDIGKAIDFEQEGNHVSLGTDICKKYDESPIILNVIASHHEDVPKDNVYSVIVALADSISAARPGARNNLLEDFVKRMREIETICNEIPGVIKSYALQSGRQIRVIVDPIKVDDFQLIELASQIREEIKKKVIIPGDVTLTLIREKRAVQKF
jgi:ribonuclease Y